MIAWSLFTHPVQLAFDSQLWLLLPLCAGVGVIYKTIRTGDLRRLPREIIALMGYMVVGLAALCVGLWLVQRYWP